MMNPVPWLQMTNMISYQGLVRTFPKAKAAAEAQEKVDAEASTKAATEAKEKAKK